MLMPLSVGSRKPCSVKWFTSCITAGATAVDIVSSRLGNSARREHAPLVRACSSLTLMSPISLSYTPHSILAHGRLSAPRPSLAAELPTEMSETLKKTVALSPTCGRRGRRGAPAAAAARAAHLTCSDVERERHVAAELEHRYCVIAVLSHECVQAGQHATAHVSRYPATGSKQRAGGPRTHSSGTKADTPDVRVVISGWSSVLTCAVAFASG
jgi:hypothetical protein